MFNVRRKRSPLIDLDPPKPLAVGDVCPLCRQVVQALQTEKTAEPLVTETGTARGDARPTGTNGCLGSFRAGNLFRHARQCAREICRRQFRAHATGLSLGLRVELLPLRFLGGREHGQNFRGLDLARFGASPNLSDLRLLRIGQTERDRRTP